MIAQVFMLDNVLYKFFLYFNWTGGINLLTKYMSFYKGKRILVTGHTGFKGAWLCRILLQLGAEVTGYALEPPTQPNLYTLSGLDRHIRSVIGDIRDLMLLQKTFAEARPEVVFHLAAQPIVKEGYRDPVGTYSANVMGTVHVLECVRQSSTVQSVVNVTTDKVYWNREWVWGYRENERLDGYDPYSNSKSCSELVTGCYARSFLKDAHIPVSTLRAGNVIGGGDFAPDRIVPDCVRSALARQPIVVRNPHSVRPYQHVLEPLMSYLVVAQAQVEHPELAGSYNVGPDNVDCVTTGQLAQLFCDTWGEGLTWQQRTERTAPHEANLLRLDCSKLKSTFGWRPLWHAPDAIQRTVEWTKVWKDKGNITSEMDREIQMYSNLYSDVVQ